MTIGLILLALVAILIFFGISERFFRALGLKNWVAFLLVLALVVGAVVPNLTIAGVLTVNWGGFVVPLVIMAVLMVLMRGKDQIMRAVLAIFAVAAVAVATRMLIEPTRGALILAASLIIGFLGGTAAYLAGQSRLGSLTGAIGGIILGDIITNFLYVYVFSGYEFMLGSYGVFDSIVIAGVFAIVLYEAISAIKRTAERRNGIGAKRQGNAVGQGGLRGHVKAGAEAGEDQYFMQDFEKRRTDFVSVDLEEQDKRTLAANGAEVGVDDGLSSEDIDSFFDDYV
ncbi:MAG: DUF1614 domain-containing protein [Firmicutes bacterium]|nr:DUF1614 domain-containing protein [Bacillota bacterium]